MGTFLRDTGKELVNDPEKTRDPVAFVQQLLAEKDKYDRLVENAFHNDKTFQNALNQVSEEADNPCTSKRLLI